MSEYINREEYFKIAHKLYYKNPPYDSSYQEGYNRGLDCASHEIGKLKAADVEPVRHGRWIYEHWCKFKCSECGEYSNSKPVKGKEKYCSNCGTKMDGADND